MKRKLELIWTIKPLTFALFFLMQASATFSDDRTHCTLCGHKLNKEAECPYQPQHDVLLKTIQWMSDEESQGSLADYLCDSVLVGSEEQGAVGDSGELEVSGADGSGAEDGSDALEDSDTLGAVGGSEEYMGYSEDQYVEYSGDQYGSQYVNYGGLPGAGLLFNRQGSGAHIAVLGITSNGYVVQTPIVRPVVPVMQPVPQTPVAANNDESLQSNALFGEWKKMKNSSEYSNNQEEYVNQLKQNYFFALQNILQNEHFYLNASNCLIKLGLYEDAISVLKIAIADRRILQNQGLYFSINMQISYIYWLQNDWKSALDHYLNFFLPGSVVGCAYDSIMKIVELAEQSGGFSQDYMRRLHWWKNTLRKDDTTPNDSNRKRRKK